MVPKLPDNIKDLAKEQNELSNRLSTPTKYKPLSERKIFGNNPVKIN